MTRYNVVICGAGRIGATFDDPQTKRILTHAHAFYSHEGFHLKGFYDVNEEQGRLAAKRWNCAYFSFLEEAMRDTDVVCCTVPDEFHYDMLKKIADYPVKLVIGEKPLTKDVQEAREICQKYQTRNIPLAVNYTRRYVTRFIALRKEIQSYGKLIRGTGYYGKGILHNGSHMLDFISYLFGEIQQVQGKDPLIDFEEQDPSLEVELKVSGGTIHLHPIDCRIVTIFELELFFEKGRIRILDGGMEMERYKVMPSPVFQGYQNYRKIETEMVDYDSSFQNLAENVYGALERKEELICSADDARHVLELCYKLQRE